MIRLKIFLFSLNCTRSEYSDEICRYQVALHSEMVSNKFILCSLCMMGSDIILFTRFGKSSDAKLKYNLAIIQIYFVFDSNLSTSHHTEEDYGSHLRVKLKIFSAVHSCTACMNTS